MENTYSFQKTLNEFIFWKVIIIRFVNVETNPKLQVCQNHLKKITRKNLNFEKMSSLFLLLIGWSGLSSLLLLFGKNFG
jgi:hypothetical protein